MSLSKVREETARRMANPADALLPCLRCNEPTPRADMSLYGARCAKCYQAFCRMPMAPFNARFKTGEPKLALPRREVAIAPGHIGEHLAKKPTRDDLRGYAEELGIDVGEAS